MLNIDKVIKVRELSEEDLVLAKDIAKEYKLNIDIVSLLLKRGYDKETILLLTAKTNNSLLELMPFNSISYVKEACNIMLDYIKNNNSIIYIYADYDSDGVNSGYIIGDTLLSLVEAYDSKCEVEIYFPNRCDGYGLSKEFCNNIIESNKDINKDVLVITVDNGITKKEEVKLLKDNNIECIITDHHNPKEGEVPEGCIVINPWLNDLDDENALGLCGAGVTFKLCASLLEEVYGSNDEVKEFINKYVVHVAIATVTDVMPVTKENIIFINNGLYYMNNNKDYCTPGVLQYVNYERKTITAKDLGFSFGPQLNACGRMGVTEKAGELLFESDEDKLEEIYNDIVKINDSRKDKEKEIMKLIREDVNINNKDNKVVIAYIEGIEGIAGSIASKLVDSLGRPIILLSGDKDSDILTGSSRSYGGINLHELFSIEVNNGNMIDFGGHEAAAGVKVNRDNIDKLRDSLNKTLEEISSFNILNNNTDDNIEEVVLVDDIMTLKDINTHNALMYKDVLFFNELKEATYVIKDVTINSTRTSANPENICFNMSDDTIGLTKNKYNKLIGKEIWKYGFTSQYKAMGEPTKVNLLGHIVKDFRGQITFDIIDFI